MDLKLTADGDLDITNGELSFVRGRDAIAQDIKMALSTWLGESIYDTTAGVPYLQIIFKEKSPNVDAIRLILKQIAERRPGVLGVQLEPDYDRQTRKLTVTGTARTIDGEVDFTLLTEAS